MSVPFDIVDVDDKLNKELMELFTAEKKTYLKDIWIVTFPRSGAEVFALNERFPHLELGAFMSEELKQDVIDKNGHDPEARLIAERLGENLVELLELIPGTRFVKTHIPLSLLPPKLVDTCKVVYVARNPKDMAVSLYHLCRFLRQIGYIGDFPTFWNLIEHHPNMLFLFYENIVKDMKGTIRQVAKHLGKDMNDEQVDSLAKYLHIDNFRDNASVNLKMLNIPDLFSQKEEGFVRKGESGGWKKYFSPELSAQADKWIAENIFRLEEFQMATFPYTFQELDEETNEQLKKDFLGFSDGFVQLVWLVKNDLDFETASQRSLNSRFPFIDLGFWVSEEVMQHININCTAVNFGNESIAQSYAKSTLSAIAASESPRFIKTHLPFSLLPPNLLSAKCIYVARNPKDVAVSLYYHNRLFRNIQFIGDFPTFWDYFERDLVTPSPYWENIHEAWNWRHHENMLFLFYEEIVTDWKSCIEKVAEFLGKQLTESQVMELANHMHIDNFRKNRSITWEIDNVPDVMLEGEQPFIRTGKVHGSKDEFTPQLEIRADNWIKENMDLIPGFSFPSATHRHEEK
ncbi:hypothetical protein B566_EDAN000696 [Ephemera danica]|nr:hypothetical protein B566_EDAN000696 [Ephemera danica]